MFQWKISLLGKIKRVRLVMLYAFIIQSVVYFQFFTFLIITSSKLRLFFKQEIYTLDFLTQGLLLFQIRCFLRCLSELSVIVNCPNISSFYKIHGVPVANTSKETANLDIFVDESGLVLYTINLAKCYLNLQASAFQEGLATMLHTQRAMFRLRLLKLTKVVTVSLLGYTQRDQGFATVRKQTVIL